MPISHARILSLAMGVDVLYLLPVFVTFLSRADTLCGAGRSRDCHHQPRLLGLKSIELRSAALSTNGTDVEVCREPALRRKRGHAAPGVSR